LPTRYQSYLPYFFLSECHQKNITRLDNFLKPRLDNLIGADKNFTKAKEYLDQCLSMRTHVKPQIKKLLEEM